MVMKVCESCGEEIDEKPIVLDGDVLICFSCYERMLDKCLGDINEKVK